MTRGGTVGHVLVGDFAGAAAIDRYAYRWAQNPYVRMAGAIVAAYYTGGLVEGWAAGAGYSAAEAGAMGAAAGGFAAGGIQGGNIQSALQGAFFGMAFYGAGFIGDAGSIERTAAHAVVGCGQAAAAGGSCRAGAMSAGFAAFAGPMLPGKPGEVQNFVARVVVGGTASRLGGGSFANGAYSAAFGYLFNDLVHENTGAAGGFHRRLVVRDAEGNALYGFAFGMNDDANPFIDNFSKGSIDGVPRPGGRGNGEVYEDFKQSATKTVDVLRTTPAEDRLIVDYMKIRIGDTAPYNVCTNSCRSFSAAEYDKITREFFGHVPMGVLQNFDEYWRGDISMRRIISRWILSMTFLSALCGCSENIGLKTLAPQLTLETYGSGGHFISERIIGMDDPIYQNLKTLLNEQQQGWERDFASRTNAFYHFSAQNLYIRCYGSTVVIDMQESGRPISIKKNVPNVLQSLGLPVNP